MNIDIYQLCWFSVQGDPSHMGHMGHWEGIIFCPAPPIWGIDLHPEALDLPVDSNAASGWFNGGQLRSDDHHPTTSCGVWGPSRWLLPFASYFQWMCVFEMLHGPLHAESWIPDPLQGMKVSKTWATCRHAAMGWWRPFIKVSVTSTPSKFRIGELPGLVNIQKTIENGHRNSGFTH
jgi:hypothetical protein